MMQLQSSSGDSFADICVCFQRLIVAMGCSLLILCDNFRIGLFVTEVVEHFFFAVWKTLQVNM